MSLSLPRLPKDQLPPEVLKVLEQWQLQLEAADRQNRKTGGDVEIAFNQRLIQTGDDGLKYETSIVGGVPTATAL